MSVSRVHFNQRVTFLCRCVWGTVTQTEKVSSNSQGEKKSKDRPLWYILRPHATTFDPSVEAPRKANPQHLQTNIWIYWIFFSQRWHIVRVLLHTNADLFTESVAIRHEQPHNAAAVSRWTSRLLEGAPRLPEEYETWAKTIRELPAPVSSQRRHLHWSSLAVPNQNKWLWYNCCHWNRYPM